MTDKETDVLLKTTKTTMKQLLAPIAILLLCGMAACGNKDTHAPADTQAAAPDADSLPVALPPVDATPVHTPQATELPAPASPSKAAQPSK